MGKDKQVKRERKRKRKVHCITCNKSMSWEFFRNNHKHKRHGVKNVPVRVISESQLRQDNANNKPTHSGTGPTAEHKTSDVRSFFEPLEQSQRCAKKCFLKNIELGVLHPFSKLRDLSRKWPSLKCRFMSYRMLKIANVNNRGFETHFGKRRILNRNELNI